MFGNYSRVVRIDIWSVGEAAVTNRIDNGCAEDNSSDVDRKLHFGWGIEGCTENSLVAML